MSICRPSSVLQAGFTPVFECARQACGGFDFATLLAKPVIAATPGDYGFKLIAALMPTGGDMRYGAFQHGAETVCVVSARGPGKPSGALLVRTGPLLPGSALPSATASSAGTPAAAPSPATATNGANARAAAQSIWSRIPQ